MTAQITNKTDSFTVYKDFRLSVLGEETVKLSKTFDDNSMNVTIPFAGITSDKSVSIFAWDKDMTPLTNVLQ